MQSYVAASTNKDVVGSRLRRGRRRSLYTGGRKERPFVGGKRSGDGQLAAAANAASMFDEGTERSPVGAPGGGRRPSVIGTACPIHWLSLSPPPQNKQSTLCSTCIYCGGIICRHPVEMQICFPSYATHAVFLCSVHIRAFFTLMNAITGCQMGFIL